MKKREYELLNKAIFHFMEDEPSTPEEEESFGVGWTTAMNILDDMSRSHLKEIKRRQENRSGPRK